MNIAMRTSVQLLMKRWIEMKSSLRAMRRWKQLICDSDATSRKKMVTITPNKVYAKMLVHTSLLPEAYKDMAIRVALGFLQRFKS